MEVLGALLAACHPLCGASLCRNLRFRELMSKWIEVMSRRQRRYEKKSQGWRAQSGLRAPEWLCAACKTQSFLSRDTCRGCGKQRDEKHDECINEWSQTVAWPQQGGGASGDAAYLVNKPKGAAQAFASARQQLAQAKAAAMPEACLRILETEVQKEEAAMRKAQHLGQKMDQVTAQFRRAVKSGEKATEALQKAQANFEQAQQEVIKGQSDLHKLMQEAPKPVIRKST